MLEHRANITCIEPQKKKKKKKKKSMTKKKVGVVGVTEEKATRPSKE
jgi:hypothetical protein